MACRYSNCFLLILPYIIEQLLENVCKTSSLFSLVSVLFWSLSIAEDNISIYTYPLFTLVFAHFFIQFNNWTTDPTNSCPLSINLYSTLGGIILTQMQSTAGYKFTVTLDSAWHRIRGSFLHESVLICIHFIYRTLPNSSPSTDSRFNKSKSWRYQEWMDIKGKCFWISIC